MSVKLIHLCADDYALTPGVSLGIRKLVVAKRITSASAMTLSPYWLEESDNLKQLLVEKNLNFPLGLHLTLTDHKPLTNMPLFCPNGKMPSINKLILLSFLRKLPLVEIETELHAQIEKFIAAYGKFPSHIDGHHHIHILPGIRDIVLNLYKAYNNFVPIRSCCNSIGNILLYSESKFKSLIINFLGKTLKRKLIKEKISTNRYFSGIYNFNLDKKSYGEMFKNFLKSLDDDNVIMCHPGLSDEILSKMERINIQREEELKYLLNEEFDSLLKEQSCKLITN